VWRDRIKEGIKGGEERDITERQEIKKEKGKSEKKITV
jgi:hypothetical protein